MLKNKHLGYKNQKWDFSLLRKNLQTNSLHLNLPRKYIFKRKSSMTMSTLVRLIKHLKNTKLIYLKHLIGQFDLAYSQLLTSITI